MPLDGHNTTPECRNQNSKVPVVEFKSFPLGDSAANGKECSPNFSRRRLVVVQYCQISQTVNEISILIKLDA
jgi:hypothetical protein